MALSQEQLHPQPKPPVTLSSEQASFLLDATWRGHEQVGCSKVDDGLGDHLREVEAGVLTAQQPFVSDELLADMLTYIVKD